MIFHYVRVGAHFNFCLFSVTSTTLFVWCVCVLKTKLSSAAAIAASGRNVTIVKCGSLSAEQAMFRLDAIEKATFLYSREKE